MLIKYSQTDKKAKITSASKQQRNTAMKGSGVKAYRRTAKGACSIASKRATPHKRIGTSGAVISSTRLSEDSRGAVSGIVGALDNCDNSNDSGLGFEHNSESHKVPSISHPPLNNARLLHFDNQEESWDNHCSEVKRQRLGIKVEKSDDLRVEDSFSVFSVSCRNGSQVPGLGQHTMSAVVPSGMVRPVAQSKVMPVPGKSQTMKRKALQSHASNGLSSSMLLPPRGPDGNYPLTAQLPSSTLIKNEGAAPTLAQLLILAQPESQHRARYQTEGSRGAVKDRSGNGFPIVKLVGFNGTAKLQVFIGTDLGRVAPHMFYQACRVSGKNSTPCSELKVDGTILIEVDFDPSKDMVITCDCVGILKERNVDVEHRFPDQSAGRSKKKSTRCRMVFRANLQLPNGSMETLQAISQPIVCTQPPGVPEICKKSLTSCVCSGGAELFILGKNFLKDTRVVFCLDGDDGLSDDEDVPEHRDVSWEEQVVPDREFLQPTHLVCVVPPYCRRDIVDPVQVKLLVTSSGKKSEAHTFTYTPEGPPSLVSPSGSSPSSPATTTSLSPSATCIAPPAMCLGSSLPGVLTSPGSSDSKLSVRLIAPALTISTAAAPPEPPHEAISLSIEANSLMGKMEPSELPMQTASARISEAAVNGMNHLPPAVGSQFIACHPPNQGGGVKEGVHPVVLWSSDVGGIKVLSSPLQLSPPASSVQLSLPNTLTEQQICPPLKETPSTDIPKTAPSLMASSNSEVNLIQQFVSDNISSPLPAQSGQSVEKFLSRIEQKPPNSSLKVEDNEPHVSDVPSANPPLPSNIVMQFASILQSQKIVVDQQVPSSTSEIPTSVSGHSLVMDSLRHSISPTAVKSESAPSPVISNQPESSNLLATNPSSITFVKPIQEQTMSTVGNDRCSHGMSSALPIASAKISSKEPISVCEMSLLQGISDGQEVRSNQIPQSLGCMVNIQNSQLPLEASMQTPCSLTSKPITASLSDGASLTSTSDQPLPPQVNLEHDSLIPIVSPANILHGIDSPSPPKDQMKKLSCDSMPSSDAIPLSVSSSVGLVEHLESTMRTNIQIGVDNLEGRSNENQNLRISQSVVPLERSGSCQVLLHHVEKERAADPLADIHPVVYPSVRLPVHPLARKDIEDEHRSQSRVAMQGALKEGVAVEKLLQTEEEGPSNPSTQLHLAVTVGPRKGEDGGMVPQELTQMSDHDLLSYINPSCFDQV